MELPEEYVSFVFLKMNRVVIIHYQKGEIIK